MGHETPSESEPIAGRYTLDRMLGAGGAAVVYEGRDLATERSVALKVYRRDGSAHPRIQQNLEIAALAKLRHANLVTLYDGGTEDGPDGRTYLVMASSKARHWPNDSRKDRSAPIWSATSPRVSPPR